MKKKKKLTQNQLDKLVKELNNKHSIPIIRVQKPTVKFKNKKKENLKKKCRKKYNIFL